MQNANDFEYNILYNSCLFNEEWYIETYFKNNENVINPILHYLMKGVKLNFNPNPIFDTEYYLTRNGDVKSAGMNPLLHYILYGKSEGRPFSKDFQLENLTLEEELYYNYPKKSDLILHGIKKIIQLKLFDNNYYIRNNPIVTQCNVTPLIHFLKIGANKNRNPSSSFNTAFYKSNYPELEKSNLNPLIHFAVTGIEKDGLSNINEANKFKSLSSEDKIEFLNNKIHKLDLSYNQKINNMENILNSYHDFFNFIFINTNITPKGLIRNTQLQTLEMLKFIVNICEKNNITYWLDYGTLIGAIRHQGFVPWDDEVDICMPRKDFEKFIPILTNILENNEQLNERAYIQIAWIPLRDFKNINSFPSPCIQFVDRVPLANVDIQIIDNYDLNSPNAKYLFENDKFFKTMKRDFIMNLKKGVYEDVNEAFIKQSEKVCIVYEDSDYLGYSFDFDFRTPLHVNEVYPLKKVAFEGNEFNSPKNPVKYLNCAYYTGDIMKVPNSLHNHDRTTTIPLQLKGKDINKEFEKTISFWKYMNSMF